MRMPVADDCSPAAVALRYKLFLLLDAYDGRMQEVFTTPAPTLDFDLTHEPTGSVLDFIQNTKSSGFALTTFVTHLMVLFLIFGAVFFYS
jgi:hypothetical protein